ncbi:MAG: electron transfer flavoprotein [Deltaproteobacteria bacterium]|nr:MAG: electron transfer flavoprotein [Deltaproteobacteria bacterium]
MNPDFVSPADASVFGIPVVIFTVLIPVLGMAAFTFIMAKRMAPLVRSASDPRLDRIPDRLFGMVKYAIGQWRHPRYLLAGVLHIVIFAGFMILSLRSLTLVLLGISSDFVLPGLGGIGGDIYGVLKDIAGTLVLVAVIVAMIRRGIFKPERYTVPRQYGKDHTWEAILVLALISTLMLCDMVFEGTGDAGGLHAGGFVFPLTGHWIASRIFAGASMATLQNIHLASYFIHDVVFFCFLCFLPLGKHFHVITSLPNVFFRKLRSGSVKPVKWGVDADALDDLESFGVKKFEDFTWKHILDFYTCADCGRCSDQCPANAAGRPLSPRFISVKSRDYAFKHYPIKGDICPSDAPLVGNIFTEDEIWSCTTCGACEAECPLFIEYIDKIVDLRRGMVDDGMVPQSLQKPLRALEKRGNPWGKMERKRIDWIKDKEFAAGCEVKVLDRKKTAETLYFVDSITSFDDRMQAIAQASARVLSAAGIDFGILGKLEKDSGNEVRRFGEEMLFLELRDQNTEAILKSGVQRIVTADPHAFNALTKDYEDLPPVEHISQVILKAARSGQLNFKPVTDPGKVYTYHDPCYLGRHNGLYDDPRAVLDAIPALNRIDMEKSRDRSFCCGGGGLMLFYEPEEDQRMGVLRVHMAEAAGANVIVTACPFCLVNIEDAIKVSGLEGKMEAIDLVELVDQHIIAE